MKTLTLIGILFIALGGFALIYKSYTYTSREKVLDLGPIEATATTEKTVPLSPILGVVSLVGGIVLVVMGQKK